jgi:hypothetical protein
MTESKEKILAQIDEFQKTTSVYFEKCSDALSSQLDSYWRDPSLDFFWDKIPADIKAESDNIVTLIVTIGQKIARLAKSSLLVDDADIREIKILVKRIRSAICLKRFYYTDSDVVHDEGTVLGFQYARQGEGEALSPQEALSVLDSSINSLKKIVQLTDEYGHKADEYSNPLNMPHKYRPNSAFIMMWMDSAQPELEDVRDTVTSTFNKFGIKAIRADDIEHEGIITQRILDEVKTSEFLFADLTGTRPNVYYEVGYAHALGKRVILFRKKGTGLHFDLAGYNCPEYENLRDLKEKLSKRLESITNKKPK